MFVHLNIFFCRRYEVIEEVDEEKDSSYCSNTSNRPKSKTKREKDKENANKKNGSTMKETEKSISIESSFETEEREVLTETDNNSSNWITESEMTVTQNNEDSSNLVTTTTEYTSDEIKEELYEETLNLHLSDSEEEF